MTLLEVKTLIREVPNFPKPGILFRDITSILENSKAFKSLARCMAEQIDPRTQKIIAIESRGFILGSAVAQYLDCGMVLVRKPGKLPREVYRENYELEYGTDSLEIHKDALKKGDFVTIIDDVLATGGTAAAVERLCVQSGAQVLGSLFLMEIAPLNGRSRLAYPAQNLL